MFNTHTDMHTCTYHSHTREHIHTHAQSEPPAVPNPPQQLHPIFSPPSTSASDRSTSQVAPRPRAFALAPPTAAHNTLREALPPPERPFLATPLEQVSSYLSPSFYFRCHHPSCRPEYLLKPLWAFLSSYARQLWCYLQERVQRVWRTVGHPVVSLITTGHFQVLSFCEDSVR